MDFYSVAQNRSFFNTLDQGYIRGRYIYPA